MSNTHGSHWIRSEKRRRIYARDKCRCLWCWRKPKRGEALTLDHFTPRVAGGCNHTTNLFTACLRCNSARRDTPAPAYARKVGRSAARASRIITRIVTAMARPLPVAA